MDVRADWIIKNAADVALVMDYLREHPVEMSALVTMARISNQAAALRAAAS